MIVAQPRFGTRHIPSETSHIRFRSATPRNWSHLAARVRAVVIATALAASCPTIVRSQPIQLVSPNPVANGQFGAAVSAVADINGDGVTDVIVGAWQENPDGIIEAGRAYVYSGSTGMLLRTHTSPNLAPPAQDDGRFGCAVAGVRDLNGDSVGDYVVGAYREDTSSFINTGRAYVYSGASGALLHTLESSTPQANGFFGFLVAGVPDLDGDGIDDVAVSALIERVDPTNLAGRVHLYSGASGAFLRAVVSPAPRSNSRFGGALCGIIDVTGDGLGDVVVGAYLDIADSISSAGKVYVFNGATGDMVQMLSSPNAETSGRFGISVSSIRHMGSEAWLLVGADQENPGASPNNAGRAYLYSSTDWSVVRTLNAPVEESGAAFGFAVAAVPDMSGDAEPDLAITARTEDVPSGAVDAGRVHVFSGALGDLVETFDSPNAENTGAFGYSLAPVAGRNTNGRCDLAIGAITEDPNDAPDNSGRAYIHAIATSACRPGDFDDDQAVTPADVAGFVAAMLSDALTPTELCRADMNMDTLADGDDIGAFVNCVTGACP